MREARDETRQTNLWHGMEISWWESVWWVSGRARREAKRRRRRRVVRLTWLCTQTLFELLQLFAKNLVGLLTHLIELWNLSGYQLFGREFVWFIEREELPVSIRSTSWEGRGTIFTETTGRDVSMSCRGLGVQRREQANRSESGTMFSWKSS